MEEVSNYLDMMILNLVPEDKPQDDDEDLLAMEMLMGGKVDLQLEPATIDERLETEFVDVELTEAITWDNINFDDLRQDIDEEDSNPSISDVDEEQNLIEVNLPYERDLHASNNEFEVWAGQAEREEAPTDYEDDDNESVTSENMPDNRLNPIEELGIDLIDPSRDNTLQPTQRRVGLVWDPGGSRPLQRRFTRLAGKGGGILWKDYFAKAR
jgi:hypothetical protein